MSFQERKAQEDLLDDIFGSEMDFFFDSQKSESDLLWENNTPPVSINEFIESPEYLNMSGKFFPAIQYALNLIEKEDIREADLMFGKGSGKTTILQVFMVYEIYKILKLRNPQSYFELIPGTSIACLIVSVSADQAKEVGFKGIKNFLDQCMWFKGKYEPLSMQIRFPKNVTLYCGSSSGVGKLGFNSVICAMDEVDYMKDSSNKSVAQELYRMLKGSMTTRYPGKYKLLCVSSPNSEDSFLTKRFNMVRDNGRKLELPRSIDVSEREVPGSYVAG